MRQTFADTMHEVGLIEPKLVVLLGDISHFIMQPFARAIQREIDLPVFSWGTLLDYAYSVVVHRDYYGHV